MAERTHCHDDRPKLSVVYNCRKNKDKRYRNNNNRYQQRKQLESQVHQRDEENRCRGGSSRGRGDGRHKHVKLVNETHGHTCQGIFIMFCYVITFSQESCL